MLESLIIKNYALIDDLNLKFTPGLTIVTGETGAGKSIMLDALSLLLGERAETKAISDKSRKSVIEATFSLSGVVETSDRQWYRMEQCGIDSPTGNLCLRAFACVCQRHSCDIARIVVNHVESYRHTFATQQHGVVAILQPSVDNRFIRRRC